jgi:hypothetical protein
MLDVSHQDITYHGTTVLIKEFKLLPIFLNLWDYYVEIIVNRTGGQILNTISPANPTVMIKQFMRIHVYTYFERIY